jgi:hypothetical protein
MPTAVVYACVRGGLLCHSNSTAVRGIADFTTRCDTSDQKSVELPGERELGDSGELTASRFNARKVGCVVLYRAPWTKMHCLHSVIPEPTTAASTSTDPLSMRSYLLVLKVQVPTQ